MVAKDYYVSQLVPSERGRFFVEYHKPGHDNIEVEVIMWALIDGDVMPMVMATMEMVPAWSRMASRHYGSFQKIVDKR